MYSVRRYKYHYFYSSKKCKKQQKTLGSVLIANVYERLYKCHFTHKHQPVKHNVLYTSIKYLKTVKNIFVKLCSECQININLQF